MRTVYVGCALAHVPADFLEEVSTLRKVLVARQYHVRSFLAKSSGTEQEAYRHDIEEGIAQSEMVLALCDYPSTGLGFGISYALHVCKKPVLAVAHRDAAVSRVMLGVPHALFSLRRYQNLVADVPEFLRAKEAALVSYVAA